MAATDTSFIGATLTQFRVIQALMLREILARFGRLQGGYLWALFIPIAQVGALYLVWVMLRDRITTDLPVMLFLLTGVLPFWLFRQTFRYGSNSAYKHKRLLNLPQVSIFDITLSHALLELLTILLVFVFAVAATRLFGEYAVVEDPLGVVLGFGLMWAIGTGMGMIFNGLSNHFPSLPKAAQPLLQRPLFFTSGLFFTAEMLPTALREILLYNPLLHVIEYTRSRFFYDFESPYYDLVYPALVALAFWAFGLATMRLNQDVLSKQ